MKHGSPLLALIAGIALTCGFTATGWSQHRVIFEPERTLNAYGLYLSPELDRYDSAWGGGLSFDFFTSEIFGWSFSGAWVDPAGGDDVWHNYTLDVVLRYPVEELYLAPYVLVGGGFLVADSSEVLARAGGGLDMRFLPEFRLFTDWIYTFTSGGAGERDAGDYQMIRLGAKFEF